MTSINATEHDFINIKAELNISIKGVIGSAMTQMMKAAIFVEPGRIVLDDKPIPDVGSNDALIRLTTTTICGTDVHILRGEYPVATGLTVGHVAPWKSVFKIHTLCHSDVTFVLTKGGHNTGIVSEPGHRGRHCQ